MAKAQLDNPYIGVGIYGIADAVRLTGIPASRIRRWMSGYSYTHEGQKHRSAPIWNRGLPEIEHAFALSFLDLMEIRFADAFIKHGVGLHTVRRAVTRAEELFGQSHPFCDPRFQTDGQTIFVELSNEIGDSELLDLVKSQYAFKQVLRPYLKNVEYDDGTLVRWWPTGNDKGVVIDPQRSFGKPIVDSCGIPTDILKMAYEREKSADIVAKWYDITAREVRDAVRFEESMAA